MKQETKYYWKNKESKNFYPFSIAHNKKECAIVENRIKEEIEKSKGRLIFKKELTQKIKEKGE